MRAELAGPGRQLVGESVYNQLFTMHGSIMMFLFAVPMAFGFANYLVPLHAGRPRHGLPPPERPVATGCSWAAG